MKSESFIFVEWINENLYCEENKVLHITMKMFLGCCSRESKMRFSVSWWFTSWLWKVAASLEEQAFTSEWGLKAKVFSEGTLKTLTPTQMKLMDKIKKLGVANLAEEDREKV